MNIKENNMAYVHLAKEDILGSYQWKGKLDLINIIMVGIANEVPVDDRIREDVNAICNLSQGIREKGGAEREEKIILNVYNHNFTMEQIALATNRSVEETEVIIKKHNHMN